MAKGWVKISTVNDVDNKRDDYTRAKADKNWNRLIRTTKSLSAEDLKKESEMLYDKVIAEEDKLLQAFADKKVKSKAAIKQALRIKKERAAAAAKAKKSAEQNTKTASNEQNEATETTV